jgi:hypothetical protein
MKTRSAKTVRRFQMQLLPYGNSYYIDRIADLEKTLARKPRRLQIDLIGIGEIPADFALLIRSLLQDRSPKTQIITNACSSLQGGSVLVWLLGDTRRIRVDARLFFRQLNPSDYPEAELSRSGKQIESKFRDSDFEIDPEEADYVRMLQGINEYLPVRELAGRFIGVPLLRELGLLENAPMDHFLATALGKTELPNGPPNEPERKRVPVNNKTVRGRKCRNRSRME